MSRSEEDTTNGALMNSSSSGKILKNYRNMFALVKFKWCFRPESGSIWVKLVNLLVVPFLDVSFICVLFYSFFVFNRPSSSLLWYILHRCVLLFILVSLGWVMLFVCVRMWRHVLFHERTTTSQRASEKNKFIFPFLRLKRTTPEIDSQRTPL